MAERERGCTNNDMHDLISHNPASPADSPQLDDQRWAISHAYNGSNSIVFVNAGMALPASNLSAPLPILNQRFHNNTSHYEDDSVAFDPNPTRTITTTSPQQLHVPLAQKDFDDPTAQDARRVPVRSTTSTPATLSRLFAAHSPSSPPTSRVTSYTHKHNAAGIPYTRCMPAEPATLPNHLYTRGFLGGRHSDIDIVLLGKTYKLHRIILDRAPFFASALSEPWAEASAKRVTLHPEEVDSNITQTAFELVLKRLYGCPDVHEEEAEAIGLFATGCWLEMQDVIDASVDVLLRYTNRRTVSSMIQLLTSNYYGRAGTKILNAAKTMLSREGAEMPLKYWDGIPSSFIQEVIGSDSFFIQGEWERWLLVSRLFNRNIRAIALESEPLEPETKRPKRYQHADVARPRQAIRHISRDAAQENAQNRWYSLYTNPEIVPLCALLDNGVHYMYLDFHELHHIRSAKDCFGVPLLPENVITEALWANLELRQRVVGAAEHDVELSLSIGTSPDDRHDDNYPSEQSVSRDALNPSANRPTRRFWIPNGDCNIVYGNDAALPRRHSAHAISPSAEDSTFFRDVTIDMTTGQRKGQAAEVMKYCTFPPFRFAAEFANPHHLKEKKRVYSKTVFYAGSLWNLYIQKVRSAGNKTPQLGVYLHRVKSYEPEDTTASAAGGPRSSVDERIGALEREMLMRGGNRNIFNIRSLLQDDTNGALPPTSREDNNNTSHARNNIKLSPQRRAHSVSQSCTPAANDVLWGPDDEGDAPVSYPRLDYGNHHAVLPPYVDGRPTIKTYFKIYCPSKGGRITTSFESSPDSFNFSQSWGWKSNTLLADEDFELDLNAVGPEAFGSEDGVGVGSRNKTLRFAVVIGVV